MRGKTRVMIVSAIAPLALVAAACGGGGDTSSGSQSSAGGAGGEISIRSCTPQNPLIPANTNEVCGGNVLDAVEAKLVHYNADTAAPELDIAQSIDTTDNQNFTVKLKPGIQVPGRHRGHREELRGRLELRRLRAERQPERVLLHPVRGLYRRAVRHHQSAGDSDCKNQPPKAKTMSGLKVVDDHTFTIKTSEKVSNLPVRLGYTVFAPLPDSFFKDPKAYAAKPIGAGPFKVDSISDTEMVLSKFADYSGKNKPNVDKVTFRIYNDDGSAAYNDVVANNLDITDLIPTDRLTGDLYKTELPDRNGIRDTGIIAVNSFSPIDPNWKDIRMREAVSMAIDRDLINKQIFNGTHPPLDGWVSPVVDGFKAGACGDNCKYNPDQAKKLYAEAGGYKNGPLTIAVNGDGGHKPWADAACNSIKNTLGLDCVTKVYPTFAAMRTAIGKREVSGLFRSGWQMDYPSIENFLAPIYGTGAGSNDTGYSSKAFDAKLAEAAAATSSDEANQKYQEAEAILGKDFPTMPMWSQSTPFGWSDRVTDVKMTPFSTIDLTSVKVK